MRWAQRQRIRTFLIAVTMLAALAIFLVWLTRRRGYQEAVTLSANSTLESSPAVQSSAVTPSPPTPATSSGATPSLPIATPPPVLSANGLIIPVAGVRPEQLLDTFSAARGEGRVHDAIDIPAPQGTPVLAAAGGKILKLFQSNAGGTTIYQLSSDQTLIYYYAHLDRYAEGLAEGQIVGQGQTIAYVGDTGNAGPGNYHLHFSIAITSDPKRWWEGSFLNPYPLLRK